MNKIKSIIDIFEDNLLNSEKNVIKCFEETINNSDFDSKDDFDNVCIACFNCLIVNMKLYEVKPTLQDYDDEFLNSWNEQLREETENYLKDNYKNTMTKVNTVLQTINQSSSLSEYDIEYINLLIVGIIQNNEQKLISAFEINNTYTMANLYLFIF